MPTLDVTDVLLSTEFVDTIAVTRRVQSIDDNGRTVVTSSSLTPLGVVTIGADSLTMQKADSQNASSWITVHCVQRLLDAANGNQPDLVNYNNQTYIVRSANNWSHYGAGFYMSYCELQDLTSESL